MLLLQCLISGMRDSLTLNSEETMLLHLISRLLHYKRQIGQQIHALTGMAGQW